MNKGNILILMSGGTTSVINRTLKGIVDRTKKISKKIKIYSGDPGIEGVLQNKFIEVTKFSKNKINDLSITPGSHFIGTTRIKKLNQDEIKILNLNLLKKNITNIVNIGGNGTLQQTIDLDNKLKNFTFIACPKTVDNDLGDIYFKKMYTNPGFGTCVKVWNFFLKMINLENQGARSHDKVIISQTFGRDTGFICGSIRFCDKKRKLPIMLLLPEDKQSFKKILKHVKHKISSHKRLMIFMSEGYKLGDIKPKYDKSGQVMFGSSGSSNAQILCNKLNSKGIQSRIFNPTILQRVFNFDNKILSRKDSKLAYDIGTKAIDFLQKNNKSFLLGLNSNSKIIKISFKDCKNFTRRMPDKFILKGKFDVSNSYIKYLKKII